MGSDLYSKAIDISNKAAFVKKNYVFKKSISFEYYKYRILRPLLKAYTFFLRYPSKNKPWLAPAAINILDAILNKNMTVLEYGSGNSTVFISERSGKVVSIEHHPGWFERVRDELKNKDITNVDYHQIEPDQNQETKKEIEVRFKKPFDQENQNYHSYYSFAESLDDEMFDLILIDGRARVECATRVSNKIKSGGILILDNSERERYKSIHQMYSKWPSIKTTTGLTDTTFWFKP